MDTEEIKAGRIAKKIETLKGRYDDNTLILSILKAKLKKSINTNKYYELKIKYDNLVSANKRIMIRLKTLNYEK